MRQCRLPARAGALLCGSVLLGLVLAGTAGCGGNNAATSDNIRIAPASPPGGGAAGAGGAPGAPMDPATQKAYQDAMKAQGNPAGVGGAPPGTRPMGGGN
jgi:hypothetical protein